MAADALIDTGAILAILRRNDEWHEPCQNAFRQLRTPLLTSEAVLTELFHLIGDTRAELETAWGFVRSGALMVGAIEDAELSQLRALMLLYSDRPMDFAGCNPCASSEPGVAINDSDGGSSGFRNVSPGRKATIPSTAYRPILVISMLSWV